MTDHHARSSAYQRMAENSTIASLVFATFTLAGASYIIIAKQYGITQFFVTIGPVVVMFVYALLLMLFARLRLRDDQAGDNLYYMGFLFTLVSLAVSLYQFSATKGADEIVRNFGIAISSTIVGIAARIMFNMTRQDPIEIERVARVQLSEAARRFRRELDNSIIELNHFRRAIQQSLNDGYSEITDNVRNVSNSMIGAFENVADKTTGPLEAVGQKSSSAITDVTGAMLVALQESATTISAQNSQLAEGAQKLTSTLSSISDRLAEMQTPERVIEIRLDPVITSLRQLVSDLGQGASEQRILLTGSIDRVASFLQTVTSEVTSLRSDVASQASAMQGNARRIDQGLSDSSTAMRSLQADYANNIEQLAKDQAARAQRQETILRATIDVLKARLPEPIRPNDTREPINGG
ncbi:hypothetical protein PY365_12370 [Roseiarcaceae bacterium H3SJ34-1]|uniref:hypothetical protein n=1 Tax=Terripilifer ovatus TaxID=3032367 RepID=UPI003AB962E2|nr:hypothetical protein [Roseiarcaceae bacterium H3SJ34-1]